MWTLHLGYDILGKGYCLYKHALAEKVVQLPDTVGKSVSAWRLLLAMGQLKVLGTKGEGQKCECINEKRKERCKFSYNHTRI